MEKRNLGWTELKMTAIGLGTWAIGGGGWEFAWGPQDDKISVTTIERAIDRGIDWIDTAPAYGLGHSEEIIGRALKKLSKKPIVATKCGLVWGKSRHIDYCLKKKSVRKEAEASLKRLGVPAIDLYQVHWPTPDEDIEEAWIEISKLIKEGKVRYAGVSNFTVDQISRAQKICPVASLQPPYNLLRRDIERGIIDYCRKENIGIIAYSPMERGLLTGKFTKERVASLPQDDHRRLATPFREPYLSANLKLVDGLRSIADRNKKPLAQLAIAWVLRQPGITAAIVGARKISQIDDNIGAPDWHLTKNDIELIEDLLRNRDSDLERQLT